MEKSSKSEQTGYATCNGCFRVMSPGNGCRTEGICIEGKGYYRIKAGDELDLCPDMSEDMVCHDCNVKAGQYHHFDCDAERCPKCHKQLILCDCKKMFWIINMNSKK